MTTDHTVERAREEAASDAIRTLAPGQLTPLAAEARAGFKLHQTMRELAHEQGRVEYLLRVISRLEGHNDNDLARMRHLGDRP